MTLKKIGEIGSPVQISIADQTRLLRKIDVLGGTLRNLSSDVDSVKRALGDLERAMLAMPVDAGKDE